MNTKTNKQLPTWLPFVVGTLLVVQFAGLGVWQVNRGLEKRADRALFNADSGFTSWRHDVDVRPYQRLRVTGRYDAGRQFLLENIIINGRNGYYVVTPLIAARDEPPLLVNRGWIEKGQAPFDNDSIAVPAERVTVRGRVGSLPRAGYKMGAAIRPTDDWPRTAVFPSIDEVSAALGNDVQPFVLLMDHQEANGFVRNWAPTEFGPGKHFGYAVQWFAMAAVLSALLVWNYRKKKFTS